MLQRFSFTILILILFSANVFTQVAAPSETEKNLTTYFSQITKGSNSAGRGVEIRNIIENFRVKYSYLPFTSNTNGGTEVKGWNIIAEIRNPNAVKTLMIGAHYDRVSKGIGAIDNASGSIAILELLNSFKESPLKNYNLQVAFWDKEELGLLGSREYVKENKKNLPDIYLNFDVFGYGDTIFLKIPKKDSQFGKIFKKSSEEAKVKAELIETYPPSDHLSFNKTKTESYSFSIMDEKEGKNLIKLILDSKAKIDKFPRIAQLIHTEKDNLEQIDAKAIARALPVIEKAIRDLDNN